MNPFLPLPIPLPQTYAAWPVWSDSTTAPIRFQSMPKKAAVKLWHRARDFDRGTHQPGRHGGAVGPRERGERSCAFRRNGRWATTTP